MAVRTGPVTRDASTVPLGLGKVLVGPSLANIASKGTVLDQTIDSLGALNSSNFTSTVEYWKLKSGFPELEDLTIPLSEVAQIDCEFKEVHPRNLAFARGLDASSGYPDNHSGEIALGAILEPAIVRAEMIYTYPNKTNRMIVIFPRAQVTSSVTLSLNATDNANVPITIESKRSDSDISGGNSAWDSSPLGRIFFD